MRSTHPKLCLLPSLMVSLGLGQKSQLDVPVGLETIGDEAVPGVDAHKSLASQHRLETELGTPPVKKTRTASRCSQVPTETDQFASTLGLPRRAFVATEVKRTIGSEGLCIHRASHAAHTAARIPFG